MTALSNARLRQVLDSNTMSTRRDASTIQLDVGYRGSILAIDDRNDAAQLRAGDRAPDATKLLTADGERRLFNLIGGGHFTLLNFGAKPVEGALNVGREIIDTAGHLATAYAATDRTLVLIRPDGYIGLISDAGDASAVAAYHLS
jgi:hypothetical protein